MPPPHVILFGACDRHNLGDLLFPHVAAALLPGRACTVAGLAARDLRACGGHDVQALHALAGRGPATLVHAGGEILTCSAWQAAVMLLSPDQLQPAIAYLQARPVEREAFVRACLGTEAHAPYVVARRRLPGVRRVVHAGVGGIDLDRSEPALRDEVLATLREADAIGVRDSRTQGHLAAAGIRSLLLPDPVAMLAELHGDAIRRRADDGELAALRRAFPQGYLAVQCSAEFGDDTTLAALAAGLEAVAARTGLGVALFRAGAAPWHDDLGVLQRLAARLRAGRARVVAALDIWTLCALIAASDGFCGSSLHGRIVATAFGRPRLNLRAPAARGQPGKPAAYAATWERAPDAPPAEVEVADLVEPLRTALAADRRALQSQARWLAARYREGFASLGVEAG